MWGKWGSHAHAISLIQNSIVIGRFIYTFWSTQIINFFIMVKYRTVYIFSKFLENQKPEIIREITNSKYPVILRERNFERNDRKTCLAPNLCYFNQKAGDPGLFGGIFNLGSYVEVKSGAEIQA